MAKNTQYDHNTIEEHWHGVWEETQLFQDTLATADPNKESLYLLFAFAYPSGQGLHVGHVESKTALDILARFNRMHGKTVFFPVGWDAFGLPAENYAVKTGVHPAETTRNAIDTFRRQIKRVGISYDWKSEIATSHPGYYKWTQWLFLELYKKGLAYQGTGQVNWCPSCQTVLANEQVVDGKCERCDSEVIQKEMKQWYFKITDYKDELISGLDQVDWPKATKLQQLNWIGKKTGINITYQVDDIDAKITVFTTRPDTNYGATFLVLAPEHEFVKTIVDGKLETPQVEQVREYLAKAQKKTELERQQEGRNKTGAFTGFYAVNQLTNRKMPIWISDFVLSGFGTGAVVGVPGHDLRDFEFAKAFDIEVLRVVVGPDGDTSPITSVDQVQEDVGKMINSGFLDGVEIAEAIESMMDYLEEKGWGKRVTTFKLRDWLISRQRYWGAPIPIVYDPEGKPHPVKEEHLPWTLPTDVDFKPTGESPLTSSKEFQDRVEKLYGPGWRPEYDTMDTFVDSSWYYLRYVSARDESQFSDPERLAKYLPVDFYMIGPEHIVLHLLYSRFFTKFLRDLGYLKFDEPFLAMRHQGMILGPDNKKMSKSKGNVINPDDIIQKFGADTLRMYEMFMGPIESDKPWDISAVAGVYRFLQRVLSLVEAVRLTGSETPDHPDYLTVRRKLHQTIEKVSKDIPARKYNTAIAALMECVNVWEKASRDKAVVLPESEVLAFIQIMAPFAPFMTEELYQRGRETSEFSSVHQTEWPSFDPEMAAEDMIELPVQVDGKVRAKLRVAATDAAEEAKVISQAQANEVITKWLDGKTVVKTIYIPGKILSFVTK
ncbi:MAG: leucine--tRNA ligase [Candidatus Pacebacteria bacterium CG_4_10_14_0_8_um_filter_42_14]|nr:MAG: leucine--tRNA ligase [Candidatus Pacebacteria bacterium CG_4_10_14_0_8_um_filter_42_14]